MISMRMIKSSMFLSLLRFFSCSWLSLINRSELKITRGGLRLAISQMINGRTVAAAKISRPLCRNPSWNIA